MRFAVAQLNDLSNPGSLGIEIEEQSYFLVRSRDQVVAYRNRCPHLGVKLDWQPDQFLDVEKQFIQCATHGALFVIQSGECIAGPCTGDHLEQVPVEIDEADQTVYLCFQTEA